MLSRVFRHGNIEGNVNKTRCWRGCGLTPYCLVVSLSLWDSTTTTTTTTWYPVVWIFIQYHPALMKLTGWFCHFVSSMFRFGQAKTKSCWKHLAASPLKASLKHVDTKKEYLQSWLSQICFFQRIQPKQHHIRKHLSSTAVPFTSSRTTCSAPPRWSNWRLVAKSPGAVCGGTPQRGKHQIEAIDSS